MRQKCGGGVKPSVETAVPAALAAAVSEDEGIVALADEGVETYAVGDELRVTGSVYTYEVLDDDSKEVVISIATSNKNDLKELNVPSTVTDDNGDVWSIKEVGGFRDCNNLESVIISEGVTTIRDGCFINCDILKSISMPSTLTSIGRVAFAECFALKEVEIPEGVSEIRAETFEFCDKLETVRLPGGLTSIGEKAFHGDENLATIDIPESVTSIGQQAFSLCKKLSYVNLKNVTQIGAEAFGSCDKLNGISLPDRLVSMGEHAFSSCRGWTRDANGNENIVIPRTLDKISANTFGGCQGFTMVTIPDSVAIIEKNAFASCVYLDTLNITVSDISKAIPVEDSSAFQFGPSPRQLVFWNADGTKRLTGDDWKNARDTYLSNNDGDTTDNLWYGWLLEEPPEAEDTHKVTITVQKDDSPWTDHNRTFALTKDSTTFVTDLDAVEAGTYTVYDVTGVAAGDFATKGMNTGVTVTVADTDASAIVEYYTVAFCYLDDDGNEQTYGDSTDWNPQMVLKTVGRVAEPATNPTKADHAFDKWVTAPNGETAFAFGTTEITAPDTKIYAKWMENTVTTYHTVTFYDGTTPYGADTPQKPQSVADGQTADRPEDPEKAGWEFTGWKTADGGSTAYDFGTPVTGDIGIYASWVKKTVTDSLRIKATATEGGTIAPEGEIIVSKGGERTFTITPDEGYRIKSVTVDDGDVTADLKETRARAQTGARYYTFTNIVKDHTIHAEFERDGGENPNPNPTPGGDGGNGGGGTGDNSNPGDGGGHSGGGGNSNFDGGNNGGSNTNPDGGNGAGNTVDFSNGENTGNTQATSGTETSSAQAGSNAAGVATAGASGQTAGGNGTAAGGKEPKTGDTAYWEVYATLAMVAGLTYLLLYIMEESRGMTEREKEAAVAALIRWGKKGGSFRKCCAMAAIFGLLMYYHAIGKRGQRNDMIFKIS